MLEIIHGKTITSEASRQFDLLHSEIESWVDDGERGMESALRAKQEDVRELIAIAYLLCVKLKHLSRNPWRAPTAA